MKQQFTKDIIKFLKESIKPLENRAYGLGYRASVYLIDGTFLPCVIFRNPKTIVNLAINRFKEEQKKNVFSSKIGYYNIVKSFVTTGNCVNEYDIAKVEISDYAFPLEIQKQIQGETSMGWTGFAARMDDGKYFAFGSRYHWNFFQMPDNYSVNNITEIINHCYVQNNGELKSYKERSDDFNEIKIYREKPFFECYLDNL